MGSEDTRRPDYGNWTPRALVYVPAALGLLFLTLALLWWLAVVPAAAFLVAAACLAYVRHAFGAGGVQAKVYELLLGQLDWDGRGQALDVGCGNAGLTVRLAQRFPAARVTGIDRWGAFWEFSKEVCETNARVDGVGSRVSFQQASAVALPFEDGTFDAAVSNLVFHEVRDAKDKRALVREALRVVKPGGAFAFQDLFFDRGLYGDPTAFVETIQSWGTTSVTLTRTGDASFIPLLLRLPSAMGTMGIIAGRR